MKKENNTDERDSSENEVPNLNSLKPFGFEPKTNIRASEIFSSSLKQLAKMFYKIRSEPCNFIKKETLTQVSFCEFCKISRNTFFHRTSPHDCF